MRILLVGEYSGLHLNLRDGLRELGHEVYIASTGDAWKKIAHDISLGSPDQKMLAKINRNLKPFINLPKLIGYDVVQFINPYIFNPKYNINKFLIEFLINHNDKAFFVAAGCDFLFRKSQSLNYSPCKGCEAIDCVDNTCSFIPMEPMAAELYSKADGVIPILYDYAISHSLLKNVTEYIPLPINMAQIKYQKNTPSDHMVFFHGLNRPGFKGTEYVRESFNLMENTYSDVAEFLIDGHMSLNRYLKVMQRMNVVVDQTSSYGSGMNALFAMAMGKVVLGGSEKDADEFQYGEYSPVINIQPNIVSINHAIEYCLDNKNHLDEWGVKSRNFVERYHDHISVADKFIQIYKRDGITFITS